MKLIESSICYPYSVLRSRFQRVLNAAVSRHLLVTNTSKQLIRHVRKTDIHTYITTCVRTEYREEQKDLTIIIRFRHTTNGHTRPNNHLCILPTTNEEPRLHGCRVQLHSSQKFRMKIPFINLQSFRFV